MSAPIWTIVSGPSKPSPGGLCTWRAKSGSRVIDVLICDGATPDDVTFNNEWAHAVNKMKSKTLFNHRSAS
jgi:hypothetical protein